MPAIERGAIVNAAPEKVWKTFMDLDGWPRWNPHLREAKLLDGSELDAGAKARVTLKLGLASDWEVTELDPGRAFTWVSKAPGLRTSFAHSIEPVDGGSRVSYRIETSGPLALVVGPVLGAVYGRNLRHSLNGLKALLEA